MGRVAMELGTAEQFRWLDWIVKCVLVLNLADAIFTLIWVRWGLALEANALMRDLVNEHALGFMLAKLLLVSGGSWLLWQRRHHSVAVVAIFTAFIAYYAVLLYHVQYASHLVVHFLGMS
jgi:hypothetical protein